MADLLGWMPKGAIQAISKIICKMLCLRLYEILFLSNRLLKVQTHEFDVQGEEHLQAAQQSSERERVHRLYASYWQFFLIIIGI